MKPTTINKFNRYFRYKYNYYYNNFKIVMPTLHLPMYVFAHKIEQKKIKIIEAKDYKYPSPI